MGIRAVIFDIGGVLEVTPPTRWRQAWATRLGVPWSEMASRLEATWEAGEVGGIDLADVERRTMAVLGLTETDTTAFMADLWVEYLGSLNQELAVYFDSLRPRYRTGILSNSFVGARERECVACGFDVLCDTIVYSHEEGMKKPDPRFYRIVAERLGVEPHEALYLDDVPACVEGARNVGMTAVTYLNNVQAIAELESHLESCRLESCRLEPCQLEPCQLEPCQSESEVAAPSNQTACLPGSSLMNREPPPPLKGRQLSGAP